MALAVTYAGPLDAGEAAVRPLHTCHNPLFDLMQVPSYPVWQCALDGVWGDEYQNEWGDHYLYTYGGDAIETLQRFISDVPSPREACVAITRIPFGVFCLSPLISISI